MDNPYKDELRRELWEMCVRRDLEAFLACDWSMTAPDFQDEGFLGIDACQSRDPHDWIPKYPTLESYHQEFERQALEFSKNEFDEDPRTALYASLSLSDPKIDGESGLIVKTFNGSIPAGGETIELNWQSIFQLRRYESRWLIAGFVGYLPLA